MMFLLIWEVKVSALCGIIRTDCLPCGSKCMQMHAHVIRTRVVTCFSWLYGPCRPDSLSISATTFTAK